MLVGPLRQAGARFAADRASRLGAALAYYAVFSLAPLLLVAAGLLGVFVRSDEVKEQVARQAAELLGTGSSELVRGILDAAGSRSGAGAIIIGAFGTVLGVIGIMGHVKMAVDDVRHAPHLRLPLVANLRRQLSLFGVLLSGGAVLTAGTAVSTLGARLLPVAGAARAAELLLSAAGIGLVFTVLYRMLPDNPPRWRYVIGPAFLAAALFTVGKWIFSVYLGSSGFTSPYGAAGSLAALLAWLYFSSQIFLYGAALTAVLEERSRPDALGALLVRFKSRRW